MAQKKGKKHLKPSSTCPNKRQKISEQQDQQVLAKFASDVDIDVTAINPVQSPLLRLPAELRDRIWAFAYGNQKIRVEPKRFWQEQQLHHALTYWACRHRPDFYGRCECFRNAPLLSLPFSE